MAVLIVAPGAMATTYNSPTVDGVPPRANPGQPQAANDPTWATDELLVEDPVGDSAWGPNNDLQGLWVTWNEDGIFFSVQGALWDRPTGIGANTANLYIDIDYGEGTGYGDLSTIDQEALGAVTRNFWRPLVVGADFGVDWGYTTWSGRFDLGFLDVSDPDAPVNLFAGQNASDTPSFTSAEGVIEARDQVSNSGYELFVPWSVFYPDPGAGNTVPPGTQIALVVAQVGGGDSLSPESIPDQSTDRVIDRPVVFTVDGDADGVPDLNWPPNGAIVGTVTLDDPSDTTTAIDVIASVGGVAVGRTTTPAGGGDYRIPRLAPGNYEVTIRSSSYFEQTRSVTVVDGGEARADFTAVQIRSGVDFSFAFVEGPQATTRTFDVQYVLTDDTDQSVVAEGLLTTDDPTSFRIKPVLEGDYTLFLTASSSDVRVGTRTGYRTARVPVTVVTDQFTTVPQVDFTLVQGERLVFREYESEGYGDATTGIRVPESLPDLNFFARRAFDVAVVDANGDEALITPEIRQAITLNTLSIDPRFDTFGVFEYWTLSDDTMPVGGDGTTLDQVFDEDARLTRVGVRVSAFRPNGAADPLEVARLRVTHPTFGLADLEVKMVPRLPDGIDLEADSGTMVAGDRVPVSAQLIDINGDDSEVGEVLISFVVEKVAQVPLASDTNDDAQDGFVYRPVPDGRARVEPFQLPSEADGSVGRSGEVEFVSDLADTFRIRGVADNGQIEITSALTEDQTIIVTPGPAAQLVFDAVQNSTNSVLGRVTLTDRFGNRTNDGQGTPVTIDVDPAVLVVDVPASVTLDENGTASFEVDFDPALSGILEITVERAGLATPRSSDSVRLQTGLVAFDEPAPESNPNHNSDADIDLTGLKIGYRGDDLEVVVPFSTTYGGAHMMVALEVFGDEAGITSDFFTFPIQFDHELKPDFLFTYKVSANDYGDLRRPDGGAEGDFFDWQARNFPADPSDNNAVEAGALSKTDNEVTFRFPMGVIAPSITPGVDEIRVQVYVTEEGGQKFPALDSIPQDLTLDMVLDDGSNPLDASNVTGVTTRLSNYVTVVPEVIEEGVQNLAVEAAIDPVPATQNEAVLVTASPTFRQGAPDNAVLQLFADLSGVTGGGRVPMTDDGVFPDETALDGVYSTEFVVPGSRLEGEYPVVVEALELTTNQAAVDTALVTVEGTPEFPLIFAARDSLGDDHGPNQRGEDFLYYEYPTSGVFFDGVFDLAGLEVRDAGDRLLLRVQLRDLTNPAEPGAADWGAVYPTDANCPPGTRTDLNLQNVIILLDTKELSGSTELPDSRFADIARQDAWEYALVYDGWWKGLVKANEGRSGDWTNDPRDAAWYFCADDRSNTIDGFLSKDELTDEELANIESWDVIVLMSGHDGNSTPESWGQVRWVLEGRSQEWNFGGGRNTEDNRERDPNIIDLLAIPGFGPTGSPKPAGRTQEEMLDYLSPEAQARFNTSGGVLNSVEIEATNFRDESPPAVTIKGAASLSRRVTIPWEILLDSPVVINAEIRDLSGVSEANLFWRAAGEPPSANRRVSMGQPRADLESNTIEWVADLRWQDIAAATDMGDLNDPAAVADSVRFIVVGVEAVDILGNASSDGGDRPEETIVLPLEPLAEIRIPDILTTSLNANETFERVTATEERSVIDLNEGSRVVFDVATLKAIAPNDSTPRFDLVLSALPHDDLDFSFRSDTNQSLIGPNDRFLGIVRRIDLEYVDGDERQAITRLPEPVELSLHFPSYLLDDENPAELQFYRYEDRTQRWIKVGAHGDRSGPTVTAEIRDLGTYAVFRTEVDLANDELVTGLQLSPNPFSPNNDGLYDNLNISYVLPFQTDETTLEVFDVNGERVRIIKLFDGEGVTTGRTLGLEWDGRDENGNEVPMGIYIVRVEVKESASNRVERETKAVAVVR